MAKVDSRQLRRQYELLKKNSQREVRDAMNRTARKAGFAVLAGAQDRVPVMHGTLRLSLNVGNKNNVFNLTLKGDNAEITVGSGLDYAKWVEEGYTQNTGQFVPGRWKGRRFVYDPDSYGHYLQAMEAYEQASDGGGEAPNIFDYGMILTGKRIPGTWFLKKSREEIDSIMDELVQEEIEEMLRRLFPYG